MSYTNQTSNYGLPQYVGSDKPTYLVDMNGAYRTIDTTMKNNANAAAAANSTAEAAQTVAAAAETASAQAVSTANSASTTATSADNKATTALTQAGSAITDAQVARELAENNPITNIAPAYDPSITYAVGSVRSYDGKIYKNIVAVTTPEQFDINKWDDVTVSELITNITNTHSLIALNKEVSRFIFDGTTTIRQGFKTLADSVLAEIRNLSSDIVLTNIKLVSRMAGFSGAGFLLTNLEPVGNNINNFVAFTSISMGFIDNNITNFAYKISTEIENDNFIAATITNTSGTSLNFYDSNTPASGFVGITADYYKLR